MWVPLLLAIAAADPATPPEPAPAAVQEAPAKTGGAFGLGLDAGLDLPVDDARFPMASTRVELVWRAPLGGPLVVNLGLRSGYSYAAGESAVSDAALGVDAHALLMAHRIPLRGLARFGLRGEGLEAGLQASGGADVVLLEARSFGRSASSNALTAAMSAGAYALVPMGDALSLGLVGEWDSALVDIAARTPGLSGDLSAMRIALLASFLFG